MLAECDMKPSRRSRSDSGLTTLEWLLIVAAVAGLAALAVVLVQNVVDETAEQITGSNARITAAQVAAAKITNDARTALPAYGASGWTTGSADIALLVRAQTDADAEFRSICNRLAITYSDAGVKSEWNRIVPAKLKPDGTLLTAALRGSTSDKDSANKSWADSGSKTETEANCKITE